MEKKCERIKLTNIFSYEEKRKFIQTLLIISGILIAFNVSENNISIFVLFLIATLLYIIFLSIIEKQESIIIPKNKIFMNRLFCVFAAIVGFCFSAIIFIVGFIGSLNQGISFGLSVILWFLVYGLLGTLVSIVLIK